LFAIDSATGVVTAHVSLIGRAGTHHITVTATSDGVSTSADFTITVTDVNHAPTGLTDTDTAANTVSEDTVIGSSVGLTIAASDTDGDTLTYTLSSDAGGLFAINTTTGVVTVASSLSGKAGSYTVTATASDGALSASADFTITVDAVTSSTGTDSGSSGGSGGCGLGSSSALIALLGLGGFLALALRRRRI
jgi:hypothetical protein